MLVEDEERVDASDKNGESYEEVLYFHRAFCPFSTYIKCCGVTYCMIYSYLFNFLEINI
jgi:hypothetical protein